MLRLVMIDADADPSSSAEWAGCASTALPPEAPLAHPLSVRTPRFLSRYPSIRCVRRDGMRPQRRGAWAARTPRVCGAHLGAEVIATVFGGKPERESAAQA